MVEQINHRLQSKDEEAANPRLEGLRVLPCVDSTVSSSYFAAIRAAAEIDLLPTALASTLAYRVQSDQPDVVVIATETVATSAWWGSSTLGDVLAATPTLLLAGDANLLLRRRAARSNIYSVLPLDLTAKQLLAAIRAAVEGLAVTLEQPSLERDENAWAAADERFVEEPLPEQLTAREAVVLRLVALGHGNKEIASRLEISEHTAKFHVSSVLAKLGAASRTEAVTIGILRGLVAI